MKTNLIRLRATGMLIAGTWVVNPGAAVPAEDRLTEAARHVAKSIRREALLPPNGPQGRPVPLVSHWNVGTVRGTFEPDHQIGLVQEGHHILPWISWPQGDPENERFKQYHERVVRYFEQRAAGRRVLRGRRA